MKIAHFVKFFRHSFEYRFIINFLSFNLFFLRKANNNNNKEKGWKTFKEFIMEYRPMILSFSPVRYLCNTGGHSLISWIHRAIDINDVIYDSIIITHRHSYHLVAHSVTNRSWHTSSASLFCTIDLCWWQELT